MKAAPELSSASISGTWHSIRRRVTSNRTCAISLKFLEYAPVVFLSAKTGAGVERIYKLIREVYGSANQRITTGELNRFVERLPFEERKIFYITQPSVHPPTFVLFTNRKSRRISPMSAIW